MKDLVFFQAKKFPGSIDDCPFHNKNAKFSFKGVSDLRNGCVHYFWNFAYVFDMLTGYACS